MEKYDTVNPDEADLENALGALVPRAPRFTSQQLAFRAGLIVGQRQANRWRGIAAAAVIIGTCAFFGRFQSSVLTIDRANIHSQAQSPDEGSAGTSPIIAASYLQLRDAVLRDGWIALPPASGGGNVEPGVGVMSTQ